MDEKIPEAEPFRLKVKYNHEEMYLPEDEAAALAQKGMNYDKLQKSYEELKNDKSADLLDELTKEYGFESRAEFLETLKKGTSDDSDGELKAFLRENPDLDPRSVPDEVITDYLGGKSISESYLRHRLTKEKESLQTEIERLRSLLEIKEENARNAETANGSLASAAPAAGEYYSSDELDALSDSELEHNLARAVRSMSRLSEK